MMKVHKLYRYLMHKDTINKFRIGILLRSRILRNYLTHDDDTSVSILPVIISVSYIAEADTK